MAPKLIKLDSTDDVTHVIKHIKSLKDREVIFELEKGSPLLVSSESLRLIKKTGEVLGKIVKIETTDETGRLIARKAGMLNNDSEVKTKPTRTVVSPRRAGGDIKPPSSRMLAARGGRFSDIKIPRIVTPVVPEKIAVIKPVSSYKTSFSREVSERGSRLEIELDKTSSKFSKIFILFLVILVVAVFGLAVLLPKADVTVFARSEPVTRDFELTVDRSAAAVNSASLLVPGIPISKSVSQTKSFPTTGTKASGEKVSGTVTIYNFTPNTLKLKAATTSLNADGKQFLLVSDVSGIKPGGAPTTGIKIIAADGGADYNMPVNTRFQIVNSALGNQNVYATNPTAFSGGSTGTTTKVLSQQDLDNAAASLIAEIISQAESDLTSQTGARIRVLDSGVTKEILAKTANKNVGDTADNFDMTMIAKVTGVGFREDDVIGIVIAKISQVLSSDKYLLTGAQQQYTASFKSIDQALGKGLLDVHFQTTAAYKVDTSSLSRILAGKNDSEIKEILLSKPEIDNVQVKFWPAWFVHKAPRFNGKINISTVLSDN